MSIDDWRYSDQKMIVREQALKILLQSLVVKWMEWFLNIRVSPSMNVLTIGYLKATCIALA